MGSESVCPYCASQAPKALIGTWKDYEMHDCPDCRVAYAHPFKNPGPEYYARYEDMYRPVAQTATDSMSFEYDECLALYAGGAARGLRLLDVGCGGGGFLYRARRLGFDVSGVDFDAKRLELVRTVHGIGSVYCMSLPEFVRRNPGQRYDVVTIFEVLEHLDDPGEWLDAIRKVLKPGGTLVVGVPNRDRTFDPFGDESMLEVDNPPHHLTRWRAEPLRHYVEKHGFEVSEVRALAVPRPLLALIVRNRLRFGLATKALGVDQLQHTPAAGSGRGLREDAVLLLVGLKSFILDSFVFLLYPFFRLACRLFGWQGVILFLVANRSAGNPD